MGFRVWTRSEDDVTRRSSPLHDLEELAERNQLLEPLLELFAGELCTVGTNDGPRFDRTLHQPALERPFIADEHLRTPALGAEERRLRDVDVAVLDQLPHLAVEERQQQRPDMRSIHVRVRHDDDAVVAKVVHVELVATDAAAERRDQRADLCRL